MSRAGNGGRDEPLATVTSTPEKTQEQKDEERFRTELGNVTGNTRLTVGSDNPDRKAAKVLRSQWERYKSLYTPVEDRLIGSIGEDMTQPAVEAAQAADTRSNQMTNRMQSRMGLASLPNAPQTGNRQRNRALSSAEAYNNASLAQIDRDTNIRTGLVDVGQGLVNQATGGLTDAAGMAGQRNLEFDRAQDNYKATKSANRNQMLGTAASIGMMLAF